jgi:arylsulfatase A-like enzyme
MRFPSLTAVALFGLLTFPSVLRSSEAPNILIFLVDDMGVMDTSVPFLTDAEGKPKRYPLNDFYRTPSMERLAGQGIRFNQFYAMSVCSPTRISIMTGQNAARHRATNWINPDQNNAGPQGPPEWNWEGLKKGDVTLAGVLRNQGYRTIHVGKGHFGPRAFAGADPANLGFEVNIAGASIGAPGSYYGMQNFDRPKNPEGKGKGKSKGADYAVHGLEKYHGQEIFLTEALTLEAQAAVREAVKEKKPFFLNFAHYAVHSPFNSDPRFADHYKDSGKSPAAQAFATLVEGMDKSLGDMLDLFEELGVAENTLVIFLGDNGSDAPLGDQHVVACAEPLRGKKGAHYEGGMRVPLIAAWAKPNPENPSQQRLPIAAGAIQSQVANVTDLFPTLLRLLSAEGEGAAPGEHIVDGRPLDTLLGGRPDPSHSSQFLMHYPHGPHRSNYFTVWRDGDWKVIYHTLPEVAAHGGFIQFDGGHYELFNLKNDPFEQTNLAGSEKETLTRMMRGMVGSLEDMSAVYPVDAAGQPLAPVVP